MYVYMCVCLYSKKHSGSSSESRLGICSVTHLKMEALNIVCFKTKKDTFSLENQCYLALSTVS